MDDLDTYPVAFNVITFLVLAILVCTGIVYYSADFRYYGDIMEQCKKDGYIQDRKTRIVCTPESKGE